MGWSDYHLHEFVLKDLSGGRKIYIGIPDEGDFDFGKETLAGWEKKIAEWFSMENRTADYVYDFGDNWEHGIRLEKILPREEGVNYPRCIAGKRACPPEDCGSIPGYEEICRGKSEFQKEYKDYDPERFEPDEILFCDPEERLAMMREG